MFRRFAGQLFDIGGALSTEMQGIRKLSIDGIFTETYNPKRQAAYA